ncbi:MAG TPA: aminotransferase class V-fold PLP-dependent enzyme [Pirellulales bacterium]|nr:aminotransferase class V-fold PLP-dependent enzyme [Pirellulales bacterium]
MLGPFDWPPRDPEVLAALQQAYDDGSWGRYHGPNVQRLTKTLGVMLGVEHALLCSSGTFAVQLALRGLAVAAGDEVILAGYDFPGNFRAVEAIGARPVLVDIDPQSATLDPAHLQAACSSATRAVIVSHLHGAMADMRAICDAAREHGLLVVEDACQAPGAEIDGRQAGTWGDVGVFSFGGSKLLTAGRGGAIVTHRADVAQRAKVYCEQGNNAFPLSELQAAVLLPQLIKLAERNERRAQNVVRLLSRLADCRQLEPTRSMAPRAKPAYYKLGFWCRGADRSNLIAQLQSAGVPIDAGFRGFAHRGPRRCRVAVSLEHARDAGERLLVLHHPVLLEPPATIDAVADAIRASASCNG